MTPIDKGDILCDRILRSMAMGGFLHSTHRYREDNKLLIQFACSFSLWRLKFCIIEPFNHSSFIRVKAVWWYCIWWRYTMREMHLVYSSVQSKSWNTKDGISLERFDAYILWLGTYWQIVIDECSLWFIYFFLFASCASVIFHLLYSILFKESISDFFCVTQTSSIYVENHTIAMPISIDFITRVHYLYVLNYIIYKERQEKVYWMDQRKIAVLL